MNDLQAARPVRVEIHGTTAPGFARVRDAFAAGFTRGDDCQEVGAALAVYRAGQCVVDLWAGHADRACTRPWQRDTRVNVYSTTKGVIATLAAVLVEQGKLAYDDLVTKHWPEYGAAGKGHTTVAQLLRHQAGLPGFTEPTPLAALYDWDAICAQLARQAPLFAPGEKTSYHAMTWGFLAGELLQRAGGAPLRDLLERHVTGPLDAAFTLGLPRTLDDLRAEMIAPRAAPDMSVVASLPPYAVAALVNPQLEGDGCNAPAWRASVIPAANGHASAQGIARIYAALANGGMLDGRRLLAPATIDAMTQRSSGGRTDALLGFTDNWGLGVTYNQFNMLGPAAGTFGHGGWGGSTGAANREAGVGIGYVLNQMGALMVGDPRATGLCNAIWECL